MTVAVDERRPPSQHIVHTQKDISRWNIVILVWVEVEVLTPQEEELQKAANKIYGPKYVNNYNFKILMSGFPLFGEEEFDWTNPDLHPSQHLWDER